MRRGVQWATREISRERIESPEWVEIDDGIGRVTCFPLGLPRHRQAGPTWLDSLLVAAGEKRRRFQFTLGIDEKHPAQTALGIVTSGPARGFELASAPSSPTGWFLHVGATNVLVTCVEPLPAPAAGLRVRMLETEGRDARSTLAAFRPFRAARTTDFRGQPSGVLSVVDGRAEFEIGAHRWIQIEAEW
jgi:alpha-mannosidase